MTNNITITQLKTLLNNNDKTLSVITPFILDLDNIYIIINKSLIELLENEFKNKMFIKTFLYDSGIIKIYQNDKFGYIKILENKQENNKTYLI